MAVYLGNVEMQSNGAISLGDFGFVYFIDWDQVRERKRVAEVMVMGDK